MNRISLIDPAPTPLPALMAAARAAAVMPASVTQPVPCGGYGCVCKTEESCYNTLYTHKIQKLRRMSIEIKCDTRTNMIAYISNNGQFPKEHHQSRLNLKATTQ